MAYVTLRYQTACAIMVLSVRELEEDNGQLGHAARGDG